MKSIIIATTLLVSAPAAATPTFLNCSITTSLKENASFAVKLDEDAQKATISFPESTLVLVDDAFFTSSIVTFRDYTIDRNTLRVSYRNVPGKIASGAAPIEHGICRLNRVHRAF